MRRVESSIFGLFRKSAPTSRLERTAFWLLLSFPVLWLLSFLPGGSGGFFGSLLSLDGVALIVVAVPLLLRWVRRHLLWSLRSKLILTYLLIGLAPVVLFVTLAGLSAYVLAGQFAIFVASSRIRAEVRSMASDNVAYALHAAHMLDRSGGVPQTMLLPELTASASPLATLREHPDREVAIFYKGKPLTLADSIGQFESKLDRPAWLTTDLSELVLDGNRLFVRNASIQTVHGYQVTAISSVPVDSKMLDSVAKGLGRIAIVPLAGFMKKAEKIDAKQAVASPNLATDEKNAVEPWKSDYKLAGKAALVGGEEPVPTSFYDRHVQFPSTLEVIDWKTGKQVRVGMGVSSLPSLLIERLFNSSLDFAKAIRAAFIALAVLFGLIEIIALYLAIRMSRTITQSVADLYDATRKIDQGDLGHRILVTRNDQLAELSKSFNGMAWSLERLLEEQKEKERLQNELSIAQEVQANLFPQGVIGLASLELHGVCKPARAVSGDYYDFLMFNRDGRETGLGLAIGDISGKGISAALLMATLHSAVRAYRFAGEELVYAGSPAEGLMSNRGVMADRSAVLDAVGGGELFESPGRILSLLNRHLYRSTQPEKYATLFLAHYNADNARLTYSNAGQLPPLVLGADGSVRRLDRGGTVVGLMDGMHYEEGVVQLNPGDIVIGYSDGVTEPENDFGEFGEERLVEIVAQQRHKPLQVVSDQVMQALVAWIGAQEQPDDITLVLARQK
ncbi:MAG: PP2C family protein-serine/threonine phosphatase [Acidobacteriaceae bacterium]